MGRKLELVADGRIWMSSSNPDNFTGIFSHYLRLINAGPAMLIWMLITVPMRRLLRCQKLHSKGAYALMYR